MSPIADTFWVFDDNALPCRCCSPIDAMEDGFWNCKERRWVIIEESFLTEHRVETCDGSCGNAFHGDFISDLLCAELSGRGWGDVMIEWEMAEPLEVQEARRAKQAAENAEKERLAPLLVEHHAQVDRMRRCRITAKEKKNHGRKEAAPCRSLYDYQREGGCQTLHISTECWAHEFTDALSSEIVDEKTGSLKEMAEQLHIRQAMTDKECGIFRVNGRFVLKWMPHVCYMSHPGEATWNPKWKDNRLADRESRPPRGADPRGADPRGGSSSQRTSHQNGHELLRNWRGSNQNDSSQRGSNQNDSSQRGSNQLQQSQPPVHNQSNNRFANLESGW